MDERSIKKSIKRIREEMGYSQEEMAGELGFSDGSSYWRFEDGSTRIINRKLYRFAEISGHPVEEILLGSPLSAVLEDQSAKEAESEKIKELRLYYENRLAKKDETIANLNDYIKSLNENIKNLTKIE